MPREKGTPATADLGRIFVYDAVARFNERLIGNIDAIDTASMAVLAGNVAVLVFAIDKLAGRQPQGELWAIALVGGSILACTVAYVVGFRFRRGEADGMRPRDFVPDLARRNDEAMIGAIESLIAAGETNLAVRFLKRALTILGILLLSAAVATVTLARLAGPEVR